MQLEILLSAADPARQAQMDEADSPGALALYGRIVSTPPSLGGGGVRASALGRAGSRALARLQSTRTIPRRSVLAAVATVVAVAAVLSAVTLAGGSRGPHDALAGGGTPGTSPPRPPTSPRPPASPRPSPSPSQPVRLNQAGPVLDALAAVAASRPPVTLVPGPGQYLYVLDIELRGAPPGGGLDSPCVGSLIRQEWLASDGSGRQVGYSPGCTNSSESRFTQSWGTSGNGIDFDYLAWQGLPTQPAALKAAIVQRFEGGHANNAVTFLLATGVLNFTAPPAVRSALFRMLATVPGVRYLGKVTDPLGRTGDTISLIQHGTPSHPLGDLVVIFDPKTSQILDETPALSGNLVRLPRQMPAWMAPFMYVETGIVGSIKATPPGTQKLLSKIPYRKWVS